MRMITAREAVATTETDKSGCAPQSCQRQRLGRDNQDTSTLQSCTQQRWSVHLPGEQQAQTPSSIGRSKRPADRDLRNAPCLPQALS
jgi:hypothetical protein